MYYRKTILIWALLAFMFGQFALSKHSAMHIEHGFSQEMLVAHDDHSDHDHHDHSDHDEQNHECPECLLTKSLQTAFYNSSTTSPLSLQMHVLEMAPAPFSVVAYRDKANTPRAPPLLLI